VIYRSDFTNIKDKFIRYLSSSLNSDNIGKLNNWFDLEYSIFIKELNKLLKSKLSKSDEIEWMEVFDTKKAEAQTLKSMIDKTDAAIDQMVYQLYDLTVEEIRIVEESVK